MGGAPHGLGHRLRARRWKAKDAKRLATVRLILAAIKDRDIANRGAGKDPVSDEEIMHRSPAVLALTGPRVAAATTLPAEVTSFDLGTDYESANDNGILREALRMRVRWLQELSGRAAWALGERLAATGGLTDPESVRHMTLEDLEALITGRALVVTTLAAGHRHDFGIPLQFSNFRD